MLQIAAFSQKAQYCFFSGDSQEYPIICQRLAAITGGQKEDVRMARKAERNALGIDWKIAAIRLIPLRRDLSEHRRLSSSPRSPPTAGKCV